MLCYDPNDRMTLQEVNDNLWLHQKVKPMIEKQQTDHTTKSYQCSYNPLIIEKYLEKYLKENDFLKTTMIHPDEYGFKIKFDAT